MTALAADVVVLHCDQGMGTLVRVWEDVSGTPTITHMALIDLGCENGTKRFAGDAIDNVIISLEAMATPKLDLLLISHQDTDHWSLLPGLVEAIQSDVPATTLGTFYRGGMGWKKGAKAVIELVEKHFGVKCNPWTDSRSDYADPAKGKLAIADYAGVAIRILIVNADSTKSIANGTSVVTVIDFGGSTSIIPGDATAQTLSACNSLIDNWIAKKGANPVTPCFLLTAPHHGALATIADNFTTKNPRLLIANEFAQRTQAAWLAASAGYLSKFNHPYKNVMQLLGYKIGTTAKVHNFVWYDQAAAAYERIVGTQQNFFTTVTSLTDPPDVVAPIFTMMPSGAVLYGLAPTPRSVDDILPPPPDPGVSGPDPRWAGAQERRARTTVAARPRSAMGGAA
jgi:beta-lactamase superfamily II metal-dependent hydrolase